jgi:K+-transporting ATPase ATPase A chain
MGQGIAQVLVFAIVLIALSYPLGMYMARVYTSRRFGGRALGALERGFYGLVRTDPDREQDWKAYSKSVIVFTILFFGLLYALQRLQAHLFLNPDHLTGVPSHIALNTSASFVTNTNWQYYGGEYTMSYLTQMAGLAVQQFVSAAVGMAVLAAVIRGLSRRTTRELGNSGSTSTARWSTSCCHCRCCSG